MKVLGFDAACIPSTEVQSITVALPFGGIFTAVDPEAQRESLRRQKVLEYIEERFAHFIDAPEWLQ
jgi:hypothetical protein